MDSFWNTEYGQNLISMESTPIDRLLSADNTVLEDLMDEDELLQQCSNKNGALISFLSKQENIGKLISYITRPWQEQMEQIVNHLREQEALSNTDSSSTSTQSLDPTPLSARGIHTISTIEEQPDGDPGDDALDIPMNLDQNDSAKTNNGSSTKPTLSTSEQHPNDQDIGSNPSDSALPIHSQSEPLEVPESKENAASPSNPTPSDHHNEPFDRYHELKLSDDEVSPSPDAVENPLADDDEQKDNEHDEAPPLKKRKSAVEVLLSGPDAVDPADNDPVDEEEPINLTPDDIDNAGPNSAADPELPEFDVNAGDIDDVELAAGDRVNILDDDDLPPPPPPPPAEPSKMEEIQSEVGIERVKLKYPYLASEIINCQIPQILDSILDEKSPFLDQLFDFIEQEPPLNAVLTNYWRSCIVGLVRRDSPVILQYIRRRKNLLSFLVQHIRDQSIMELVIALGWDPAIEELKELDEVADWMYDEELVPKLIATLSPRHNPDQHSAASYTLVDIVAKTSRSTNLVLFHNLASSVQIEALMNHMFAGNRSSLLESLSVLLALLHHYPNVSAEKQQFGDDEMDRNVPPPPPDHDDPEMEQMTDNPLASPQSTDSGTSPESDDEEENEHGDGGGDSDHENDGDNDTDGSDDEDGDGDKAQKSKGRKKKKKKKLEIEPNVTEEAITSKSTSKSPNASPSSDGDEEESGNQDGNGDEDGKEQIDDVKEEVFDESIPAVVRAVCRRLPDFKTLLETAPAKDLQLPFCTLSPPLGPVRHKVVDMIVALMRTPAPMVSRQLRDLSLIRICIDLFFDYPWNNLLHGSVEHIIQMVVSGDCAILKRALFEDCDFLNRILAARRQSAQHQEEKKFRLGFMGHLTRVSNTIVEFAKRNQQLDDYMNGNAKWMEFIGEALKLENEQLNTQLGGHRPSTMNGDDADDFTIFTLAEIGAPGNNDDSPLLDAEAEMSDEAQYTRRGQELDDADSDSDSDEDREDGVQIHGVTDTDKDDKYDMPQDVFSRLTKSLDEEARGGGVDEEEDRDTGFEQWFDDGDNWDAFGGDANAGKVQNGGDRLTGTVESGALLNGDINVEVAQSDHKENVENGPSEDASFENWDDDPFGDDDLFGADNGSNAVSEPKSKGKAEDESGSTADSASKQIASQQPAAAAVSD